MHCWTIRSSYSHTHHYSLLVQNISYVFIQNDHTERRSYLYVHQHILIRRIPGHRIWFLEVLMRSTAMFSFLQHVQLVSSDVQVVSALCLGKSVISSMTAWTTETRSTAPSVRIPSTLLLSVSTPIQYTFSPLQLNQPHSIQCNPNRSTARPLYSTLLTRPTQPRSNCTPKTMQPNPKRPTLLILSTASPLCFTPLTFHSTALHAVQSNPKRATLL